MISQTKEKDSLKNKKLLLATWGCQIQSHFEFMDWIPILKEIFREVVIFSPRNYYYYHGKDKMNQEFLTTLEKEKPDYVWVNFDYDEFYLETLKRIKHILPESKTITNFGDDDFRFDDCSRYYALFFDYIITSKKDISIYKKEKIDNIYFIIAINPSSFKPIILEKKYDISFIGAPVADRYEYIKFLKDNGVNISLFGFGWNTFKEFNEIYKGYLSQDDFVRVINESKINLNFSKCFLKKDSGQMKNRLIEIPACKSFMLTEYTEKNLDFINRIPKINFNTKEELLKKINYFLNNEKEMKKITDLIYKETVKNYTWQRQLYNFFNTIKKDKVIFKELPKIKKRIITLQKQDMSLSKDEIMKKIKDFDYVMILDNPNYTSEYKEYLQSYSLYTSKKMISCCDYNVSSNLLGDYLTFMSKKAFNLLEESDFNKLLNLNQFMVEKSFFFDNIDYFKDNKIAYIMNEENTVFVSIPLISIDKIYPIEYSLMNKVFRMLFFHNLFSIIHQKKLNLYPIKILIESMRGRKYFILEYFKNYTFDKENWKKLNFF